MNVEGVPDSSPIVIDDQEKIDVDEGEDKTCG